MKLFQKFEISDTFQKLKFSAQNKRFLEPILLRDAEKLCSNALQILKSCMILNKCFPLHYRIVALFCTILKHCVLIHYSIVALLFNIDERKTLSYVVYSLLYYIEKSGGEKLFAQKLKKLDGCVQFFA